MTSPIDRLPQLQALARAFVEERDWGQFHNPRNLAMALSVEASELLELYLWTTDEGPQPITEARRAEVAGEAADVLLCLLNFCDRAQIDLTQAFHDKLQVARKKYPAERVRGSALKYDEYPSDDP
ncbi:MAG: nucleotide pyrophosphohydrolase [Deltaproteobacteria bacterium]|nr:MAG: nucleotide pyrophosphohydrolase [Deltaproteobacteria bacterium]